MSHSAASGLDPELAVAAEDAPVFPGRLLGVRRWRVCWTPQGDVLIAGAKRTVWPMDGEPLLADCAEGGRHEAPDTACSCGIYAYHPFAWAAAQLGFDHYLYGSSLSLFGVAEAWGQVEVHREGFRAQLARPRAFVISPATPDGQRLRQLADAYRAELVTAADGAELKAVCDERGWGLDAATVESLLGPPETPSRRRGLFRRLWRRRR